MFARPPARCCSPGGIPSAWGPHRSTAPGPLGKHGVVFSGGTAGTYTIYLDNLRLRHADGSTTPLWTSGKDTRTGPFKANALFKDLQVRAVDVAEVGK